MLLGETQRNLVPFLNKILRIGGKKHLIVGFATMCQVDAQLFILQLVLMDLTFMNYKLVDSLNSK